MKRYVILLSIFCSANILFSQSELDCQVFRNGFFQYMATNQSVVILREGNYQIEYDLKTKQYITIKLTWEEGCDYSFVYVATNMNWLKDRIGYSMKVDIVSGNSSGYLYKAVDEKTGEKAEGHIVFLKEKLTSSQEKKIRTKLAKTSVDA